VLDRIAVDRFVLPAVNSEVRLAIAVQVEAAQSDTARNGLLEDAGGDDSAVPGDFSREANVHRDKFHER
jgi:hypothetical protein